MGLNATCPYCSGTLTLELTRRAKDSLPPVDLEFVVERYSGEWVFVALQRAPDAETAFARAIAPGGKLYGCSRTAVRVRLHGLTGTWRVFS